MTYQNAYSTYKKIRNHYSGDMFGLDMRTLRIMNERVADVLTECIERIQSQTFIVAYDDLCMKGKAYRNLQPIQIKTTWAMGSPLSVYDETNKEWLGEGTWMFAHDMPTHILNYK